jgi:tripartite-type tricarboxylate transporter receptor subunit TctC
MRNRWIGLAVLLACAAAIPEEGLAQAFPSRPIRIIAPFPPGGVSDLLARLLGEEFRKSLGQPVVIENKPGAGTVIGVDAAAKSPADGHTLVIVSNSFTVNHTLAPKLPYDTLKDLRPVGLLTRSPNMLVGHAGVPARDLPELLAYAKANPGKLSYASSGTGTIQHLIGESIRLATGMDILHIPYKGAGPAINDLLGGQVDLLVGNVILLLPHIRAGKIKSFGVTTATRAQAAAEFPTFAAQGYPQIDMSAWFGLAAPAAVPDPIVARLNAELVRAFSSSEVSNSLLAQGLEPIPGTPEAFAAHIRSEIAKYAQVLKQAKIRLE